MKKLICFFSLFLFLANAAFSQSLLNSYRMPALSEGKRLIISGNPLLEYDATDSKNSTFSFKLDGYFNYWKFTPKQSVGGYADVFVNAGSNTISDTSISSSSFGTTLYGGMNYYFKPNRFYATGSLGAQFLKTKVGDLDSDATFPMYLWAGAGYGKILNQQRVVIAADFQTTMKKMGITDKSLSISGMQELATLLDQRTNGYYDAKFKENAEVEFFTRLEKLLNDEGLIKGCLNARTALKLLQALTNPLYIYYPRYTGYQLQAELQYQLYSGQSGVKATENYMSFSGVYGKSLSYKTHWIGSAFLSFPLNESASGFGPGFFHYINFIPDRTNLDFFTGIDGAGLYGGHYTPGKTISFGLRGDIFHSISNVAGARGYAEYIGMKPSEGDMSSLIEIGARIDYNILAKLILFGQTRFTKITDLDASYNVKFGFTYYVF